MRRYLEWRTLIIPLTLAALAGSACNPPSSGALVLGGPPECETRTTCYAGLVETYGLEDLEFESIQEGAARIAALKNGDIDVALLFSTQPVIEAEGFVVLEDDEAIVSAENVVPVLRDDIVAAYGDGLVDLINEVTATITTDALVELNRQVEIDGEDPPDVASAFIEEHDFGAAASEPGDGPPIIVASFNFAESTTLAEIYAQVMESAGYTVERMLNLGTREGILSELGSGNLSFLPEYIGSALSVGFSADAPSDPADAHAALASEFEALGVTVLDYAPGEDKNVFVVTQDFADEHSVSAISDLAGI